jgi:cell division cycle 14
VWPQRFQSGGVSIPTAHQRAFEADQYRYEKFERVDMGDFNWVTPDFLAFASPNHQPVDPIPQGTPEYAELPSSIAEVQRSDLPKPFKNVLSHFSARNIGLVVRLNSELYCPSYFTALGIQHIDMIFDDGTCPPLSTVRKFINLAHDMINNKHKGIAVHCKAGLGRTGCLIGAYLIYRNNFTANEVIAFMRFMRPGMVVGPQQHWLHLNQGSFREWWYEDNMKEKLSAILPSTPSKSQKQRLASNSQTFTPPNGSQKRSALGEIESNGRPASKSPQRASLSNDDNLPAPTPGQPRKTSKAYGANMSSPRHRGTENEPFVRPDREVVSSSMRRHTQAESESEEEYQLRMLARRASRSPQSAGRDKRRAVSCTTTTTTTMTYDMGDASDIENQDRSVSSGANLKTPGRSKSGSGAGALSVSKVRSSPRRSAEGKAGVRKTSGRIGSLSASTGPRA